MKTHFSPSLEAESGHWTAMHINNPVAAPSVRVKMNIDGYDLGQCPCPHDRLICSIAHRLLQIAFFHAQLTFQRQLEFWK